jgi:shikimate dehydrogenase
MIWRFGVIGHPIKHSLSPRLHEAALRSIGFEGDSHALDVPLSDSSRISSLMVVHNALSVTMPLKEAAIKACDEIDAVAKRTRSVNSMLRKEGRVFGRSTDGAGFLDALKEVGVDVTGLSAVVQGSGGSARAIVDALASAGVASVAVLARDQAAAVTLCADYKVAVANPSEFEHVGLIVNTVPVGTGPSEVPTSAMTWSTNPTAVDVVYEPRESDWLAAHRAEGRQTFNGLGMLVHQAHIQVEWWLDHPIDVEALWAAVL